MSEQSVDRKTVVQSISTTKEYVSKTLDTLWQQHKVFPYNVKMVEPGTEVEGGMLIMLAEAVKSGQIKDLKEDKDEHKANCSGDEERQTETIRTKR